MTRWPKKPPRVTTNNNKRGNTFLGAIGDGAVELMLPAGRDECADAQSSRRTADRIRVEDIVWAMGSFCALNRLPFDAELFVKQFPPPYGIDTLIHAARAIGFRIKQRKTTAAKLPGLSFPCLVIVEGPSCPEEEDTNSSLGGEPGQAAGRAGPRLAIVIQANAERIVLFDAGTNAPTSLPVPEFAARFSGTAFQIALEREKLKDPDAVASGRAPFGFRWFIPELLKHKQVWRDVLLASLVIQLLALLTPLFTQVVIDKVVVHRTQSTLMVIGIGMAIFMVFSALLTWVRQYLVLHTGNRVDAVLGAAVFDHLFKLPTRYFEHRPTGVIAARLHGVENIREFVASAAVTLVLDLPLEVARFLRTGFLVS
jgi:subfamily B ATP-binding cassette protein HlyB/CyaB